MSFYGIQFQKTLGGTIPGRLSNPPTDVPLIDRIVDFDDEIIDGGTIITGAGGLFSINSSGNYSISWNITLQTGLGDTGPKFSLIENHYEITNPNVSVGTEEYASTNSLKTGQLSGTAILQIPEGQICKIGLYNTGDGEATLSNNVAIKANIVIHPYVVGTYSSSYGLIGLTLNLTDATATTLAYNEPILFNDHTTSTPKIFEYNAGIITIKAAGNYTFDWMVNLDGSQDASAISFSIMSGTDIVATIDSTLLLQNSYSGFAFVTATNGQTFRLVNTSKSAGGVGAQLTYSTVLKKATMRLIGHS